jgi:hypothetical protein
MYTINAEANAAKKLKLEFKLKKSNVGVHRQLYLTPLSASSSKYIFI